MQSSGKLTFSRHTPTELLPEIGALFAANERDEFPAWAARAYPYAEARGGVSWVGRSADGQCVAHMGCVPVAYRIGAETARAGLCVNMMVDRGFRTLLPALSLTRTVVGDARDRGFDFVFANPSTGGAQKLLASAGMMPVGQFRRLVQPVSHRLLPGAIVLAALHQVNALLSGGWRAEEVPLEEAIGLLGRCATDASVPGVVRHPDLYAARLGGFNAATDIGIRLQGRARSALGAALLRLDLTDRRARLVSLQTTQPMHRAGAASAVARLAAGRSMRFIEASSTDAGPVLAAMRAAGFSVRSETVPLQALAFTPLGTRAVASLASSALEPIDAD